MLTGLHLYDNSKVMRRAFWLILFFGAYLWAAATGYDRILLERGKRIVQAAFEWLEDADVNPHLQNKSKQASRRWD